VVLLGAVVALALLQIDVNDGNMHMKVTTCNMQLCAGCNGVIQGVCPVLTGNVAGCSVAAQRMQYMGSRTFKVHLMTTYHGRGSTSGNRSAPAELGVSTAEP
jgi:hypothetical protein